jgi:hypothetical protein
MRPIRDCSDISVFDRVEVDIIDMGREVLVVAYAVLPKAPLPDAALAASHTCLEPALAHRQAAGENRLDDPPDLSPLDSPDYASRLGRNCVLGRITRRC